MKVTRKIAARGAVIAAIATALAVVGMSSPAHADDSEDIDWVYSAGGQSRGRMDADVKGWTGAEKIVACDRATNDHSALAVLMLESTGKEVDRVVDSQNDNACSSLSGNLVPDGKKVILMVCDHEYSTGDIWDCRINYGVS